MPIFLKLGKLQLVELNEYITEYNGPSTILKLKALAMAWQLELAKFDDITNFVFANIYGREP